MFLINWKKIIYNWIILDGPGAEQAESKGDWFHLYIKRITVELLGQGPCCCLLEAIKYEHAVGPIEVNVIFLALQQLHRKMESKASDRGER